jgi:FtsH-binding integral membrane protein
MNDTLTYQRMGTTARGPTHALFAQTMGYVAATAALFALGAWLGHNLTGGVGIVLAFVHIPGADLAYSVLGLVIFAGFTMFDFQRLRTNTEVTTAPFLAASIFLDVLNVFLFFLEIFSGGQGER